MENTTKDPDYEYMLQGLFHHASEQQRKSDEALVFLEKATADMVTQRKELDRSIAASRACELAIQKATSNVGTDIKDAVNKAVAEAAHSAVSKAADAALKPMADSVKAAGQTLNASAKNVFRGVAEQAGYVLLVFGFLAVTAYALPTWYGRQSAELLLGMPDVIPCLDNGYCVAVDIKTLVRRPDGITIARMVKMPGFEFGKK